MARDKPNSLSIGGKNKLNVLMPIDVIVATTVQMSKMELRDIFIATNYASGLPLNQCRYPSISRSRPKKKAANNRAGEI